ncbi:hypothetical protein GCM10010530_40270 [Kribbella aluminosa]
MSEADPKECDSVPVSALLSESRAHRFTERNGCEGLGHSNQLRSGPNGEFAGQQQLSAVDANRREGWPGKAELGSAPVCGGCLEGGLVAVIHASSTLAEESADVAVEYVAAY